MEVDETRRRALLLAAGGAALLPLGGAMHAGAAGAHGQTGAPPARRGDRLSVRDFGALGDDRADDGSPIQAALSELGAAGGGDLFVPRGIYRSSVQLRLPNRVRLMGEGAGCTTIRAAPGARLESLLRNETQDGTQHWATIEDIGFEGNRGAGAVCATAVVDLVSLFVGSALNGVRIEEGSHVGLHIGATNAAGPLLLQTIWVTRNGGDNLVIDNVGRGQAVNGIIGINITSENQAPGRAAIRLSDQSGTGSALGWMFLNTHVEQINAGPGTRCLMLDGVSGVTFDTLQLLSDTPRGNVGIEITDHIHNTNIQLRNVTNANMIDPVLLDRKNRVRFGGGHLPWYATPDVGIFPSKSYAASYGRTIVPDLSLGNHVNILVTDGRPFTIAAPVNAVDGMMLTFEIVNLTRGDLGPVSWSHPHFFYMAWTSPAAGKRRTVQLVRRNGAWVQIGAVSPDL